MDEAIPITTVDLSGPDGRGNAFAVDLVDILEGYRTAVRGVLRCLMQDEAPAIDLEIVGLQHSSAHMELRASESSRRGVRTVEGPLLAQAVELTEKTLRDIESGATLDERLDYAAIDGFSRFMQPIVRRNVRLSGSFGTLTASAVVNLHKALSHSSKSYGSLKGRLEKINLHDRRSFSLFTTVGKREVRCDFQPELLDKVIEALHETATVTVTGLCYYLPSSPIPHRIDVLRLLGHPSSGNRESFLKARGLESSTDDSVSSIRKLRDEWD